MPRPSPSALKQDKAFEDVLNKAFESLHVTASVDVLPEEAHVDPGVLGSH